MGLALPSSSSASWNSPLNSNFSLLDLHDHSSGKGARIPTSGLNLNADLQFNDNRATELKAVKFNDADSETSVQDYSLYTSGGELYYKKASTAAVQITSSGALNASLAGGFGAGYTGVAIATYDATAGVAHYLFKSSVDNTTTIQNLARLIAGQVRAYGTTAGFIWDSTSASSNFRLGTAASGGNLILSSGAHTYTGAFTTQANILEVSPGGNVGIGTEGGGTSAKLNVQRTSGTNSRQQLQRWQVNASSAASNGHGGYVELYAAKNGATTGTEAGRVGWEWASTTDGRVAISASDGSSLVESLSVRRFNSAVQVNPASGTAIITPASTNIVPATTNTGEVGTTGARFDKVWARRLVATDASMNAPSTNTELASRHVKNTTVGWGGFTSTGTLTTDHWNINGNASNPSTGRYLITLDVAVDTSSAINATIKDATNPGFIRAFFNSTTQVEVLTEDTAGVAAARAFQISIVGQPFDTVV